MVDREEDEGISACEKFQFYSCIEMMLGDICSLNPSILHVHCVHKTKMNVFPLVM